MKINEKTNISQILKRELRKSVGAHKNCPIRINTIAAGINLKLKIL